MLQLLCHLYGDFIFQTSWMAHYKTQPTLKGWIACFIHTAIYHIPFYFLFQPSITAISVMFVTHFLMDKFRLAKYLQMAKNNHYKGVGVPDFTASSPNGNAPEWLAVWLLFIHDNTIHVTINYLALKLL